jgi:hypothetical protein
MLTATEPGNLASSWSHAQADPYERKLTRRQAML